MKKKSMRVLVVDDEPALREILFDILSDQGHTVVTASSGAEGLRALQSAPADLLITDLRMPGMDGLELLREGRALHPSLPVILMTAYGTISSAVEAMKNGAYDYLQKPFDKDELIQRVERVGERAALLRENEQLRKGLADKAPRLVGDSDSMKELRRHAERLASIPGDVLVAGESGTGKELVARALHYSGDRAAGPFVPVNCAAIPEGLAESELFGHERGAFTHATSTRAGRFEQADGGTLFLDEISSMPMVLQAKLLRVVQDRVVERVGGDRSTTVDVRIVAATNHDLPEMCRRGEFREDLYHRLNVHEIVIPPLRERRGDVPLLASLFLERAATRFGLPMPDISDELMAFLERYTFPGNVRELEHMMGKMVVLSDGDPLELVDLPPSVSRAAIGQVTGPAGASGSPGASGAPGSAGSSGSASAPGSAGASGSAGRMNSASNETFDSGAASGGVRRPEGLLDGGPISLPDVEASLLREAIVRSDGNLSEAARQLGISYKTMRYRARKFGLDSDED